jgi:putative PIN family toxin of toxin-antitoxin system
MRVVVLDTCVLISGLLSPRGASGALVDAFFADRLKLAYTPAIFAEYAEVLERPEFAEVITPADRMGVMLKVRHCGALVKPVAVPDDDWPDADDLPFVAAALATEARVIITLNPGDFGPATRHGLRVLSPGAGEAGVFVNELVDTILKGRVGGTAASRRENPRATLGSVARVIAGKTGLL